MSRIYWDTMVFIYWLGDHPQFAKRVGQVYTHMRERNDELITGAFTFGELLAGAYRKGAIQAADEAKRLLQGVVVEVIPFSLDTAQHYAKIRGTLGIPPADAIHLACAAQAETDLFLTNDKRLVGKFIPGIQFIASLETDLV